MRKAFMAVLCLIGGCTLDRIEHDSAQYLAMARLSDEYNVERGTRWRLDDPGRLEMDATYDPNDARQIRLLQAAYVGVTRVYPLTLLEQSPAYLGVRRPSDEPVALLLHVDIPAADGRSDEFPVALVDLRTGAVIDRARLTVRAGWWRSADDAGAVSQLFSDYAAQLRPIQ
jgi:hypothetical protein